MYDIKDKSEAIRIIQRYLREVNGGKIPVFPSGIYDENTKLAVKDFQIKFGITESGIVDYITFTKLFQAYKKISEEKEVKDSLIFPMKDGDSGDGVAEINRLLIMLLDFYRINHNVRVSRYFTKSTLDGVKSLKKIYQHFGDCVDEEFYLRIKRDEKIISK